MIIRKLHENNSRDKTYNVVRTTLLDHHSSIHAHTHTQTHANACTHYKQKNSKQAHNNKYSFEKYNIFSFCFKLVYVISYVYSYDKEHIGTKNHQK